MYTFITKEGDIRHLRLGDITRISDSGMHQNKGSGRIKASWQKMHDIHVEHMTKEEKLFLERYGLKTTIFNVANLREFGAVQLYDHDVQTAIEHGAADKRGEENDR
jgi:hypothetical protein